MEIKGKVAIVTGASSGIGEAIACELGRRGANVTLTGRDSVRLSRVASRLQSQGGSVLQMVADLRVVNHIDNLFSTSHEQWGRLDILVNAAGVGRNAPLCEGPTEYWREMFEVNVLAMAHGTREALRRFDPVSGGRVLNISSMAAHRWPRTGGFYAATKHAVRAITEGLRSELTAASSRSRVMSISPEFVATPFFSKFYSDDPARLHEALSEKPLLVTSEIARLALFLLEAPDDVWFHDVSVGPAG